MSIEVKKELKKILLISTNALGDTYLTCSVFKLLKDSHKEVQIDIISTENAEFFLKEVGFDNMFLIKKKSFAEMQRLIFKTRNTKYDVVFNFFPGQMNSSFFKLSNAAEKIGFTNFVKKRDWHNDEDVLKIKSQSKNKNVVWKLTDNYLDRMTLSLNSAGISIPKIKKHIFDFEIKNEKIFDIVLHLFSSDENRKISDDSIKEIVSELCKTKKICLLGSKSEIEQIEKLDELKKTKNLHIEISPDIKKLTSIISNTEIFIGVDSFPIHIADAYDVKVLGIFYYPNEKSVFQNMNNKFILRVKDTNLDATELINFIKEKKLLKGI